MSVPADIDRSLNCLLNESVAGPHLARPTYLVTDAPRSPRTAGQLAAVLVGLTGADSAALSTGSTSTGTFPLSGAVSW